MGNYSDQPDYATTASNHTVDSVNGTTNLNQSGIYCGSDGDIAVIMNGVEPSYANAVHFKGLKSGMFLPVIVDYIVSYPKVIANGTTFASPATIADAATGDYTFTADIKVNGTDVAGSVQIRIVMDGTTVTTFEAIGDSTNSANLVGATSLLVIPAGEIGNSADVNVSITTAEISPKKLTTVADIVTYK
tara:strand:- start:1050 stop:1616 length:567 start_codon:yes stop_codon:yes gene_type:complete